MVSKSILKHDCAVISLDKTFPDSSETLGNILQHFVSPTMLCSPDFFFNNGTFEIVTRIDFVK